MAPKRAAAKKASTDAESKSPPSTRKILITAGEGQTGRLLIELLATHADYKSKYAGLSALVFSEEAKQALTEFETVLEKILVFDPSDEQALVQGMEEIDTVMLIPPARKVCCVIFFCSLSSSY
jgi:predicted glycosyltransferase